MFTILSWIVYGLIVGTIAKFLHPGEDEPVGFVWTTLIGIIGSFIGGAINWILNVGGPFSPAGILMGVIGALIFCYVYSTYKMKALFERQKLTIRRMEMRFQQETK